MVDNDDIKGHIEQHVSSWDDNEIFKKEQFEEPEHPSGGERKELTENHENQKNDCITNIFTDIYNSVGGSQKSSAKKTPF